MSAGGSFPLRVADDKEIAATISGVLKRASFSEQSICDRLGIAGLDAVDTPVFKTLSARLAGAGPLEPLSRLFLFGEAIELAVARQHLAAADLEAFLATDLIRAWDGQGSSAEQLFSPVRVVPVHAPHLSAEDLLVVGDRADHPDGSPFVPFSDIVFPGHNPLTRQFLKLLPTTRPETVLELCAGSGVAALGMAASGSRCIAADIAERSVHFARFNGWLNGCDRLDVACGDLYAAVERRFDCILAHPPYVPALAQKLTYRDGGQTGDEIVRRVVAGVPDHLNVGGTFHLLCLGMDTGEGPFEERVRHWLGAAAREFDIVFALDSVNPPELIATRLIDRSGGSLKDLVRWRELFEQLQVKEFVYGAIVGRRFTTGPGGTPCTRRVLMTDDTSTTGFAWLFRWFDWLREGPSRVLDAQPLLPNDLRLDVRHCVEETEFVPASYFLENAGRPFRARLAIDAWVAALLTGFDGSRTVREVFSAAKTAGRVPPDFGETDLERLMCFLIERGCVEMRS